MLGHLIACRGGKAIPLSQRHMFVGRRRDAGAEGPDGQSAYLCELQLVDGVWFARDLAGPPGPGVNGLRINGVQATAGRLMPGDVLTIGRCRFRIDYSLPEPAGRSKAPSPEAAHPPGHQVIALPAAWALAALGRLIPCRGGPAVPLLKARVTIGRHENCDLRLNFNTISNWHCGLELSQGHWRVVDLGSRNKVRVNGVPFVKKWLFPNDILTIAVYDYRLEYIPSGDRPSADDDLVDHGATVSLMQQVGLTEEQLETSLPPESEDPETRQHPP